MTRHTAGARGCDPAPNPIPRGPFKAPLGWGHTFVEVQKPTSYTPVRVKTCENVKTCEKSVKICLQPHHSDGVIWCGSTSPIAPSDHSIGP